MRKLHVLLLFFISLQGRPPTKKATVLNKVNKAPQTPSGLDGEGTKHVQTQENIVFTQTLHKIKLQLYNYSALSIL